MNNRFAFIVVILSSFSTSSFAESLSGSCGPFASRYDITVLYLYDEVNSTNTTNVAGADYYDTVVCECRMNPNQSVRQASSKASSAITAGLWAAVPMHHDLNSRENREANAFSKWISGHGKRPTMNGALACTYQRMKE